MSTGVFEHVFGAEAGDEAERERLLALWALFGFTPKARGRLSADEAHALYGHKSAVNAIRLSHPACAQSGVGHVRLQFWDALASEGLADAHALDVGSRWSGFYTRDILAAYDAFSDPAARDWSVSPLVRASIVQPEPAYDLERRFVGLREMLVLGPRFRLALVQRAGFERPGFGAFDPTAPFASTQATHANIVQPSGGFDTDFYKRVFGLQTMAHGEAKDTGADAPTRAILDLDPAKPLFRVERLVAPGGATGMLQVYAPHWDAPDRRALSRPGARGLSFFTYQRSDLAEVLESARRAGARELGPIAPNEFGEPAARFDAPDGIAWGLVGATA